MLSQYFEESTLFVLNNPGFERVYSLLYYLSTTDNRLQKINDKVKSTAVSRIHRFLTRGVNEKSFVCKNIEVTAKLIHTSLTGLILNLSTETSQIPVDVLIQSFSNQWLDYLTPLKASKK